jgi:hypothetical protein
MLPPIQIGKKIASSAELDLVEWLKRRFCVRSFTVAKRKQNFSTRCSEKAWRIDERLDKYANEV